MVTCPWDTQAAEARWSRKSPGEISRDPFWREQQVKPPERPCDLHFLPTLLNSCCSFPCDCFPCVIGNNRCFESRAQQNASQIRQAQEDRGCISGTLFLRSLSAAKHISFPLSFCWKLSIAGIAAGSFGNKKATASSRAGLIPSWAIVFLNKPEGFSVRIRYISKGAPPAPCHARPFFHQIATATVCLERALLTVVARQLG